MVSQESLAPLRKALSSLPPGQQYSDLRDAALSLLEQPSQRTPERINGCVEELQAVMKQEMEHPQIDVDLGIHNVVVIGAVYMAAAAAAVVLQEDERKERRRRKLFHRMEARQRCRIRCALKGCAVLRQKAAIHQASRDTFLSRRVVHLRPAKSHKRSARVITGVMFSPKPR
jgi:hypothetical protein